MTSFSLFLLGAPRVEKEGAAAPLERRKALALLAYLAVTGECQRRESLAALFWPEAEATEARAALRRTLSVLNTTLGGGLDVQRDCVGVQPGAIWTDVGAFRSRLAELSAAATLETPIAEPSTAASVAMEGLTEVVELYRGDFMAGFTLRDSHGFDDWQFQQSESLQRELAGALEQLARAYAAQGDYRAALEPARRWVALDQLHEPAQRMLMQLYAWAGQPAAALRLYQECARLLEGELGAAPEPETTRLYEKIRAGQLTPPVPSATPPPIRLPGDLAIDTPTRPGRPPRLPAQTTPLLGRVGELGRMADRLADRNCRLLTVLGPGGSGKTRLALQAAASYSARTEQPVYFVPLAAAPAPDMLASAIAEALGLAFIEHADNAGPLLEVLREESFLLLLDNFEHLLPAAGLLADILAQAPGVKVLVTSRERLQLHGEWVMELGGLPYPASADVPNSDWYDAVQLFVASARRARADFAIDDASRPAVVEICRLVEGMPLGLELAAPWVRMLSVQEIATEITRNVDFLATTRRDVPPRHRSLRAAFEHSWTLLTEGERLVLLSLSVFRAGFLRTAAQEVAGASLPVLAALADKSLLRSLPPRHGEAQFSLHDLVRQFVADKLRAHPEQAAHAERAHSLYYATLLAQKTPYLSACGDWSDEFFDELANELENVRAAWHWAAAHADLEILDLAYDGLGKFYQRQSWLSEGHEAFGLAIARLEELTPAPGGGRYLTLLAKLLSRRGMFSAYLGQHDLARQQLQRGLALLRAHGSSSELGHALMKAGMVIREFGDYTEAQALLDETLAVARASGDEALTTHALSYFGYLLGEIGEFEPALRALREALARARASEDSMAMASALNNFGFVCYLAGDLDQALAMMEESLDHRRQQGVRYGLAIGLDNLAYIRAARGETEAAEALFHEALRLAQERHSVPLANDVILGLATLLPLPTQAPRAVELMTFVLQHPLSWRETKDRAERWLAERLRHLAPEGAAAAQARAYAITYEEVVEDLLPAVA